MIALVKRLELGGEVYPLVGEDVRLVLRGIGQGTFQVRSRDAIPTSVLARYTIALGGRAWPVLLGVVTEATPLADGLARVRVRELAAALELPAPLALRHVVPREVLAGLEERTALRFLLPAEGDYLRELQPYFYAQGEARGALEQMARVWQVPRAVWAQLPDGRIYWGDWAASPFNPAAGSGQGVEPLRVPSGLVTGRDELGGSLELPALPALRPGMLVEIEGDGLQFMAQRVTFHDDRVRLEWDVVDGRGSES